MRVQHETVGVGPGGPGPRSSHGVSVCGDRVYVIGGEAVARTPIDSAVHSMAFTTAEPVWEVEEVSGTSPPPRVAHAQATVDGEEIYVFGGRQGVKMAEAPLNDLYAYATKTRVWRAVETTGEAPSPRSFHRMVACPARQSLLVFGGCGAEGRLSDLHELGLATMVWKAHPTCKGLTGRGGACLFSVGAVAYVVAGFAGAETNDVFSFSLESGEWRKEAASGAFRARSVCASGVVTVAGRPHLVVFGGEVEPSDKGHEGAGGFANDTLLFPVNEADGTVSTVIVAAPAANTDGPGASDAALPRTRGWSDMAVGEAGVQAVVFGGLSGSDEKPERLDDLLLFSFA